MLARWWPRLISGLFTRVTHGLIRTGHAVRGLASTTTTGEAQRIELARALAMWVSLFTALPGTVRLSGQLDVATTVAKLPCAWLNPADQLP